MTVPDASKVINGTHGTVWVDGELWANADSFEATVNVDYQDVNFANSPATYRKAVGWNGAGSMTIKKVNSRIQKKVTQAIKAGKTPRFQIVGKLADPDANGTERVAIRDVTVDSVTLLKFEQKTLGSEDVPFAYSDYEMLDSID